MNFKRYLSKFLIVLGILLFVFLSYFKFFIIQVSHDQDTTVSMVKTENIQWISNIYKLESGEITSTRAIDFGKVIYANEMSHNWQRLHNFSLFLWWILFIFFIFKIIKLPSKFKSHELAS